MGYPKHTQIKISMEVKQRGTMTVSDRIDGQIEECGNKANFQLFAAVALARW